MEEINWGIIGCGDVSERKSGPAFAKVPHSHLVAVMRRNAEKAKDYALRHNVARWYSDAGQLINDPEVNAIYVATPPQSHAEYAIEAMRAGKPVYVEKPMAVSYAQCIQMNKVSDETKVPLFVAYYRRSLPYFQKVKGLIDQEAIGTLLTVQCSLFQSPIEADYNFQALPWRVIPEIAGGGYFYDMACHTLDVFDYFFGPIENVCGFSQNRAKLYPAEDVVTASFVFSNGLVGQGIWNFVAHESAQMDRIEICGTLGKITCSTFAFTPIVLETEKGEEEFLPPKPEHIQLHMIESIVKELRGEGTCLSNGVSGARTNHVMDIILDKVRHSQETCSRN